MAECKMIDVSAWQGVIDWNKVKASGIEGAILKAGGSDCGFYKDKYFEANYEGAKAAGVPVGAYYFVGKGCVSGPDGYADGVRFLKMLEHKQFELPVYMDVEAPPASKKKGITDACIDFCEVLEGAGYYAGIYGSSISGFCDRMDQSRLKAYDKWVAQYSKSKPTKVKPYGMWQYTSTGKVDGIKGNVDLNIAFYDFSSIIKGKHLNGF